MDTGAVSCGTGSGAGLTGVSWSDPGNITASDDSRATAALTGTLSSTRITRTLIASNFGFEIPDGSTIDGIVVEIEKSATSTSGSPTDSIVALTFDASATSVGDNKADTVTVWPTSDAYATYGGVDDTWGASPTVDDINSAGFGVTIIAAKTSGETSTTVRVDHVRVTVHYTEPAPQSTRGRGFRRIIINKQLAEELGLLPRRKG